MGRRGVLLALLPVASVVGGCEYLFGFGAQPVPPGEIPYPSPQATYTEGTATVSIGGVDTILDKMPRPGHLYDTFGLDAGWTDGNGLYLRLYGALGIGVARAESYVTLERIRDGQHWTTAALNDCRVTLDQADAKGIKGSGTCANLRWSDTMVGFMGPLPEYIEGEPPFDLAVTFEARP